MKTNYFLLIAVIFLTVLISCTKELSYEAPDNSFTGGVSQTDSGKLKRIIYIDTTATTADTVEINTFIYDNAGRVKVMITANHGVHDTGGFIKYSYHGADTIPYRALSYDALAPADTSETFYTFDAQLRRLKDSTYNHKLIAADEFTQVNLFSYYSSGFVINYFSGNTPGAPLDNSFRDSVTVNGAGNMTFYKEYFIAPGFVDLVETVAMTYDNKIDPLSKISSYKVRDLLIGGEPFWVMSFANPNNVTKYNFTFPPGGPFPNYEYRRNFIYLTNNYPASAQDYIFPQTGNAQKISYQYY